MLKKVFSVVLSFVVVVLLCSCGASQPEQIEEPDYNEIVVGTWYMRGMYYKNKLVDINDNSALKSLYELDMLTFNEDGSFVYLRKANDRGDYSYYNTDEQGNIYFILKTTSNFSYTFVNGTLSEKEYDGEKRQYHVTILADDVNTIILQEYDSLLGQPKTDKEPIIFVRNGFESQYLAENKVDIS